MMILSMILIAGTMYFIYKENRLKFIGWISNLYQIIDLSSLIKLKLQPCKVINNSLNIINERFARGEISEDEYFRIRSALNNK